MTIQLTQQILTAERDVRPVLAPTGGRFTPTARTSRAWSARLIRATAQQSLRLADRLDQGYRLGA
jgi:hypothetical protein